MVGKKYFPPSFRSPAASVHSLSLPWNGGLKIEVQGSSPHRTAGETTAQTAGAHFRSEEKRNERVVNMPANKDPNKYVMPSGSRQRDRLRRWRRLETRTVNGDGGQNTVTSHGWRLAHPPVSLWKQSRGGIPTLILNLLTGHRQECRAKAKRGFQTASAS